MEHNIDAIRYFLRQFIRLHSCFKRIPSPLPFFFSRHPHSSFYIFRLFIHFPRPSISIFIVYWKKYWVEGVLKKYHLVQKNLVTNFTYFVKPCTFTQSSHNPLPLILRYFISFSIRAEDAFSSKLGYEEHIPGQTRDWNEELQGLPI